MKFKLPIKCIQEIHGKAQGTSRLYTQRCVVYVERDKLALMVLGVEQLRGQKRMSCDLLYHSPPQSCELGSLTEPGSRLMAASPSNPVFALTVLGFQSRTWAHPAFYMCARDSNVSLDACEMSTLLTEPALQHLVFVFVFFFSTFCLTPDTRSHQAQLGPSCLARILVIVPSLWVSVSQGIGTAVMHCTAYPIQGTQ